MGSGEVKDPVYGPESVSFILRECSDCGSAVINETMHTLWHRMIMAELSESRRAKRESAGSPV
jgi:hypothetical protein